MLRTDINGPGNLTGRTSTVDAKDSLAFAELVATLERDASGVGVNAEKARRALSQIRRHRKSAKSKR